MLVRVSGGSSGICAYLANGMKSGREHSRNELDERVLLTGDLEKLDNTLELFDKQAQHEKYLHITLSFKETEIDEQTLKSIDLDFQDFIFSACRNDEFYYYSEAHLPKIKSLHDKDGSEYERFPHIHVVIPEFNLVTYKKDNPLGKIENITRYIDAFQETINYKYNLKSPKDNLRPISGGREAILNRHKITPEMSRQQIKEEIATIIRSDKTIQSVDELAVVLKGFGTAKVRDSKKFGGQYINLQFADGRKGINLKDPIFLNEYLASRDNRLIRANDQAEHDKSLAQWPQQAQKIRFIDRASPKAREVFQALDEAQQRDYLNNAMSQHLALLESIAPTAALQQHYAPRQPDYVPHIEDGRHLDDISHIDDIPHFEQIPHFEEQYEQETQSPESQSRSTPYDMYGVRVRGSDGNSSERSNLSQPNSLPTATRNDMERDEKIQSANLYTLRDAGNISRERQYGRIGTTKAQVQKSEWSQKINAVDLRALLNHLSYRYGIDDKAIKIVRSRKGYERIKHNGRQYSASDFMAKHLHLNWYEIREILDTVLEQQDKKDFRTKTISSTTMWHRFQRYEETLPGLTATNANYRVTKANIFEETAFIEDVHKSKSQNNAKRRILREHRKAAMQKAQEKLYNERRYYLQSPNERYLEWLHKQSIDGEKSALEELNRIYPTHERNYSLTFLNKQPNRYQKSTFSPLELGFNVHVNKRGEIEYRNDDNQVVIIDTRTSINVKKRDTETITKALMLAQQRFGIDGFEITNATEADKQAIQEAVNRSQTHVTLYPAKGKSTIEKG